MAAFFKNFFSSAASPYLPKIFTCFQEGYSFHTLKKDLMAGISVGVIAIPLALAAALGAGVNPERGLFTSIIGGLIVSFLGGSRVQIGGPSSTFIIIIVNISLKWGFEGVLISTLLAGIVLIIFGIYGLGTYIKYIPYPVVRGLTMGIATLIFINQLKDFFGIPIQGLHLSTTQRLAAYWEAISLLQPASICIGLGTLLLLFYFRKTKPQFPKMLMTLVIFSILVAVFHINVETIESRYGALSRTLPAPSMPHFSFSAVISLIPDAFSMALLIGIESLLSAVVSEGMTGWRHQSNCELIAQGVGNIVTMGFGGMPVAGSLTRTAANVRSGATTPIAGIVHSLVIGVVLFVFAPFVSKIPLASLSAILFIVAWNMGEVSHFFQLFTAPKKDVLVLLVVFFLTVFINITAALQVGMIMAAFLFMKQMSDLSDVVSQAEILDDKKELMFDPDALEKKSVPEGVEVYEMNGPFFFGVADRLKNLLHQLAKPPQIVILRMRKVPSIDASGMHALEEFYIECKKRNIILLLSGVRKNPMKDLQRYHLDELIGKDHIFSHIKSALEFSKEMLRIEKFKRALH